MKKFSVVIGTNYGDEGKGLTTDWLSVQHKNTAVARFSGGANAGHTVELDDGTKHVFSHFGSGTLNEVPTILTRDFIVNPVLFWNELERLPKSVNNIEVCVDPRCKVTTPLDVMLNQERERIRDNSRHGSTGVGINETEHRHLLGKDLSVLDLLVNSKMSQKIHDIREYFEQEMLLINPDFNFDIVDSSINRFVQDCEDFCDFVTIVEDEKIIQQFNHVVFEGSQGLMLDAESDDFPHVTRARTGITNLIKYFQSFDCEVDLYYVTRSYLSRHGAGPMPTEDPTMYYYDRTNQPNEFQGTLRFGELDFNRMQNVVQKDLLQLSGLSSFKYNVNTVMTWFNCFSDFEKLESFSESINADNMFYTKTPTRSGITKF